MHYSKGRLKEEVYMRQPPDIEDQSLSTQVDKLNKAIYVLK